MSLKAMQTYKHCTRITEEKETYFILMNSKTQFVCFFIHNCKTLAEIFSEYPSKQEIQELYVEMYDGKMKQTKHTQRPYSNIRINNILETLRNSNTSSVKVKINGMI